MNDQRVTAPEADPTLSDDEAPMEEPSEALEQRDLHDGDRDAPLPGRDEEGDRDIARVLRTLKIQVDLESRVFDYRHSTSPNGGRIALQACVHHIPVISQQRGRGDLDVLRRVLQNQGLMVQFGTDEEGNVAVYTAPNRLCFHARGGNAQTCGIEHMHFATSEGWLKKQFRAAAWIAQLLERQHGIPLRMAQVERAGSGRVQITRTGHTSHEEISRKAGFNDRSDPGRGFDYEQVFSAARFFKEHGHFIGA
jgi:hypothetical protein